MLRRISFLFTVLVILLISGTVSARNIIEADEIIKQINQGLDIYYNDAVIRGDLDLISNISNVYLHRNKYESYIMSQLIFEDCIFEGEIIGYYSNTITYQAMFEDVVSFKNCQFNKDITFKYSSFSKEASFTDSSLKGEAEFKYTKFHKKADFSGVFFTDTANFKYTKFWGKTNFQQAHFKREGIFKYSEFLSGVNLAGSIFSGYADFKYSKFLEPLSMKGMKIAGDSTFKYATVDGHPFTKYLINKKN